ncbi:MAG TPA: acyltransferase, partial [Polyangiaceae bacterium]|nr:acyltransferase [Polyangiaceae bacterium]
MTSAEVERAPLPALTGARFFAAFAIVVHHYGRGSIGFLGPLAVCAKAGPTAVSFFYVLSGAVLTWGCTGADGQPARPTRTFWIQRAARILPAYFLALGLSILPFAALVMKLHGSAGGMLRTALGVAASSLLVQAFVVPLAVGLNTPAWSVSCEAFFYATWPRLVAALRSPRPAFPFRSAIAAWLFGLVAPVCAIAALAADVAPGGSFATLLEDVSGPELVVRAVSYFPPFRLPEFALGIVVGHALRHTPNRARSVAADTARELLLCAALVAVTWLLGAGVFGRFSNAALANRILVESGTTSLLFALVVWQLARGNGMVQRLLARPSLLAL